MKKISESEENYIASVKQIIDSGLLEKAFLRYFGKIFEENMKGWKQNTDFSVYCPSSKTISFLIKECKKEIIHLRVKFLSSVLGCLQLKITEQDVKQMMKQDEIQNNSFFQVIFGSSFLRTFDFAHYKEIPIFHYDSLIV